jgi:hypothetical protein
LRVFRTSSRDATDASLAFADDDARMKTSYGVVWREGEEPVISGKLELFPNGLRLEGRDGLCVIPYAQLSSVRIGRATGDRLGGQPSVVVERSHGERVTIATVTEHSMIGEIADRLSVFQSTS